MLGLPVAQRFVRSGCVRGPISAAAGCLFICVRGEAKANPICEIECGSRRRLAAVIFVPSLNRMILSAKVVAQRKRGSGTGRGSAGPRRRQPKQPRSVRLVLVAVAAVSDGIHDQLTALGSYQIFLRNQDRERGGVWGVGFCVVAAQDFCDAARRLEGCFSASESAA